MPRTIQHSLVAYQSKILIDEWIKGYMLDQFVRNEACPCAAVSFSSVLLVSFAALKGKFLWLGTVR